MMNIKDFIPVGSENAISREELRRATGLNDREMRALIETAREKTAIINLQDGNGYFIPSPNDAVLAKRWLNQMMSRKESIRKSTLGVIKYLYNQRGQKYGIS